MKMLWKGICQLWSQEVVCENYPRCDLEINPMRPRRSEIRRDTACISNGWIHAQEGIEQQSKKSMDWAIYCNALCSKMWILIYWSAKVTDTSLHSSTLGGIDKWKMHIWYLSHLGTQQKDSIANKFHLMDKGPDNRQESKVFLEKHRQ